MRDAVVPRSILVLRISPTTSFFNLRASRREEHRLILLTNDSNCRMSVRIVISSVVTDTGVEVGKRGWGRGDWASRTFRTLVISFLKRVSSHDNTPGRTLTVGVLLLQPRITSVTEHDECMLSVNAPLDQ